MRPLRRRSRAGGWLLIEIILILALLALLLTVESRAFVGIARMWSGTRAAEAEVAQFDHALRQLRRDVWSASTLETTDDGARLVVDGAVTWSSAEGLTRAEAGEEKAWRELGQAVRFDASETGVVVRTTNRMGEEAELVLTSQVMLAGVAR